MLTPTWQIAVFVALNPKTIAEPEFQTRLTDEVAVLGDDVASTKSGEEVAIVSIATPPVLGVVGIAPAEEVAIVSVSLASAAPEYAVRLVPSPSQPTFTCITRRSLPELFTIELVVALPVAGAMMMASSTVLSVKFAPVGEPAWIIFVTFGKKYPPIATASNTTINP